MIVTHILKLTFAATALAATLATGAIAQCLIHN